MRVAAIVPAYNEENCIASTLKAIRRSGNKRNVL